MFDPRRLVLPAACALTATAAVLLFQGPDPVSDAASADAFSAARAFKHVEAIATEPRPVGSAALSEVREYLEREIRQLGLEPIRLSSLNRIAGGDALRIENILAVRPGKEPGPGVLLAAHYDSVPQGPGASDNAAGVAALLETLRVMQHLPPHRRQVLFLFTDGEEAGLLGAHSFVDQFDTDAEVGLVLNFEARGTRGPAVMFETSEGNSHLIAGFARASPRPLATSLSQFVYRRMPNDTDFSVFKQNGIPGLNFAFIAGNEHYHRPTDSVENVSLRSLQHTGTHALSLTRHFAHLELPLPASGNAVFFNILGPVLIHYPVSVVRPASVVLLLAAGLLCWHCRKTTHWHPVQFVRSLGVVALGLVLALGIGLVSSSIIERLSSSSGTSTTHSYIASIILAAAAVIILHFRCPQSTAGGRIPGSIVAFFVVAACACGFVLPEGSYLFFWPAVLTLTGLACGSTGGRARRLIGAGIIAAGAMLYCALIGPLLVYVFIALPAAAPALVVLASLAVWSILAPNELICPSHGSTSAGVSRNG